ncbi:MAG: magnesium protoporphyrin IX methyltransferase, partial [Pseudomonadota bacterium]|nr:magnesium protoporphyrin IX methyltransferase [Pseudomonadota bacterium]MEC7993317.1 magnesium protoporphyrin IX methyltransferase [Pseudomonadota bacterium]
GKFFPRSDRAPAIEPIAPAVLLRSLDQSSELTDWTVGREHRVSTGFYTSQAMELVREC